MPCKCDPSSNNGGSCRCHDAPPLPAGSPQRALNFSTCSRNDDCDGRGSRSANKYGEESVEENFDNTRKDESARTSRLKIPKNCQDISEEAKKIVMGLNTGCISLEYGRKAPCAKPLSAKAKKPKCPSQEPKVSRGLPPCRQNDDGTKRSRKKLVGRRNSHRSDVECATGDDVRVPCGVSTLNYANDRDSRENGKIGSNTSKTRWYDEDGCHSANQNDRSNLSPGKPCASDKRRKMLRSKLRKLLREIEPIPESCLIESIECKPEPEILAEVLLMSEAEGIDLSDIAPDAIFDNLFSDMTFDRSIAITSAAPESMSDVVIPAQITGQKSPSIEMPNSESIIENIRGQESPNLDAFQRSINHDHFKEHMSELLERTPTTQDIAELVGASKIENVESDRQRNDEGILDYVMKPGPPLHVNRVRLNGSIRPIWFPGYNLVSPLIPGYTRLTNDPGEALKEAWLLCRPRHFDDESRHLVQ